MSIHLLDINVLVAMMWPAQESHAKVQSWLARNSKAGWATCPFTQAGVVRLLSNPAFAQNALAPEQAVRLLVSNLKHPHHHFWGDEISFPEAVRLLLKRLTGHQQVSDAYLLGLALHKGGAFATLDRKLLALVSGVPEISSLVTVI